MAFGTPCLEKPGWAPSLKRFHWLIKHGTILPDFCLDYLTVFTLCYNAIFHSPVFQYNIVTVFLIAHALFLLSSATFLKCKLWDKPILINLQPFIFVLERLPWLVPVWSLAYFALTQFKQPGPSSIEMEAVLVAAYLALSFKKWLTFAKAVTEDAHTTGLRCWAASIWQRFESVPRWLLERLLESLKVCKDGSLQ